MGVPQNGLFIMENPIKMDDAAFRADGSVATSGNPESQDG